MSLRRFILVPLVLGALLACSKNGGGEAPDAIRLIDTLGRAEISGAIDLTDLSGAVRQSAANHSRIETRALHRGAWVKDRVGVEAVTMAVLPPFAKETSVWLDAGEEDVRWIVSEESVAGAGVRDRETATRVLDRYEAGAPLPRLVEPSEAGGVLVARGASPVFVEVSTPVGAFRWFLGTEHLGESPYARSIDEESERSEVIALPCGSDFRIDVTLPADAPRLSLDVAMRFIPANARGSLVFESTAGDDSIRVERPITKGNWAFEPWTVDLSRHAGKEVSLHLAASTSAPRGFLLLRGARISGGAPRWRPDVVVISLDTARADRMSLYGGPRPTTPVLDRLAETSVVFDQAITSAPWTLPAHVTMLSGQYPDRHGVFQTHGAIPDELPWVPTELRAAGYATRAFTGGGYVDPSFGFASGFERYGYVDPVTPPAAWSELRPTFKGTDMRHRSESAAEQRSRIVSLLKAERRAPLFLFLHTYQAHEYRADPAVLRAFGADEEEFDLYLDGVYGPGSNPFLDAAMDESTRSVLQEKVELIYDAAMVDADAFVGDVVAALEAAGRLDETILIVTSDHGEALLDRESTVGHGSALFEEQIRVPLLIRGPGFPARRVADVVSTVDLVPTLRELCGLTSGYVDASPLEDGRSLLSLLRGGALERRAVLARGGEKNETDAAFRARRGSRFKLMVDERPSRTRLFDLGDDPGERVDLSGSRAVEAEKMRTGLAANVKRLKQIGSAGGTAEMPAELIAELKALGYLGDD